MRHAFQRDSNHARVVSILKAHGCTWVDTADHRTIGVDGFVFCRATEEWSWVEVKDGAKPPSARKLKPSEEDFRALCVAAGMPWVVISTDEEAASLAGRLRGGGDT